MSTAPILAIYEAIRDHLIGVSGLPAARNFDRNKTFERPPHEGPAAAPWVRLTVLPVSARPRTVLPAAAIHEVVMADIDLVWPLGGGQSAPLGLAEAIRSRFQPPIHLSTRDGFSLVSSEVEAPREGDDPLWYMLKVTAHLWAMRKA